MADGARGTLVLVVGPSGAGKDTLIDYCKARLADDPTVVFPRRCITRADGAGFEDHDTLSEADYRNRRDNGGFALFWDAHALSYGVPASIADDLAAGRTVVVNVSRTVIDEARARFAPVRVASITAPASVLAARLRGRDRETCDSIEKRLRRQTKTVTGTDVETIDNGGTIEAAGERLLGLIVSRRTATQKSA